MAKTEVELPANKREAQWGISEVAMMLGLPRAMEWRVKNFSVAKAYGIEPSFAKKVGKRSVYLYSWRDIERIAIANELVEAGFTPEEIGKALREVTPSTLADALDTALLLVRDRRRWRVAGLKDVRTESENVLDSTTEWMFVLNIGAVITNVVTNFSRLVGEGKLNPKGGKQ